MPPEVISSILNQQDDAEISSVRSSKRRRIEKIWEPCVGSIDDFVIYLRNIQHIAPAFLRTRQQHDYYTIMKELCFYKKPLVITKPTGTGKTALFISIANMVKTLGFPVIIAVPTVTLVLQTFDRFIEYMPYMNYTMDDIGCFCPTEKLTDVRPITIVTQASLTRHTQLCFKKLPTIEDLNEYIKTSRTFLVPEIFFHPLLSSFLILDEGHHAIGRKLFDYIDAVVRPTLLFSASTLPNEYPEIDRISKHIITYSLRDAIEFGELSPVQFLTVDFSMYAAAKTLTKTIRHLVSKKTDDLGQEALDIISRVFCEHGGFSLTPLSLIKQILEKVEYTKKTLVFTNTLDHADLVAKMFSCLLGTEVRSYHTKTVDRNGVLNDFRSGKTKVLVAVGALDEGFDDPDINVILDFSVYVKRTRRLIQRLGRSLRLRENGSEAIFVSIQILEGDLQLMPRDVIISADNDGHINVREENLLNEFNVKLTLPEPLDVPFEEELKTIHPRAASVVFPKGRVQHKLGMMIPHEENNTEPCSNNETISNSNELSYFDDDEFRIFLDSFL